MEEYVVKHLLKKDSSLSKKEAEIKAKKLLKPTQSIIKKEIKKETLSLEKIFEEALNKESYQTLFNYVDGLGLDD